jgi:hypothetical protein
MEILSIGRRIRSRVALLLALVLWATGCMLLDHFAGGERRFAFAHAAHSGDQALPCASCHADALVQDAPGMPAPEGCAVCHEELDAAKPEARRIAGLFDGDQFRAAHAQVLAGELVFSARAPRRQAGLRACHAGIEKNTDVRELEPLTMDDCTRCHASQSVASECSTCHKEIRRELAPGTHEENWKRQHGRVVRSHAQETIQRCSMCHTESSCLQCHKEEAPQSHTQYFRDRGHAMLASLDRQSCVACHTSDSCDRCHSEVRPPTHVGNWGGTLSTHCLSCHFPLTSAGCVACHKSTPDHLSTPKPDDHTPVMICRQCHGFVAPLPHVDKGDDCNACHH